MTETSVLIVEDEILVAHSIQHQLQRNGYAVCGIVASGEEAMRKVRELDPDLILMDIQLEGELDGVGAADLIRSEFDTPVIFLTAFSGDETLKRAKHSQPFGYLLKPPDARELHSTIQMALYRHQVEAKLKESEEHYQLISELTSDLAFALRIEADGRLNPDWVAGPFHQITGYTLEEAYAHDSATGFFHPYDLRACLTHWRTLLSGQADVSEYRIVTKSGDIRWLRSYGRPEWDEDEDRVVRVLGAAQDITELKQAQEVVEQVSRQKETILSSAGEGILGIDANGRHQFVNPAAARMLGYQTHELTGQPSHSTWHHSREDGSPYPEESCPIHAGYKEGRVRSGSDETFWRKDGSSFPVHYTSTPMKENGKLMGAVIVFQDITEQRRIEAEIVQSNAELAAQNAIATTLSQSLDLEVVLDNTLATVLAVLEAEVGTIYLLEGDSPTLMLRACRADGGRIGVDKQVCGTCMRVSRQAVTGLEPVVSDISDCRPEEVCQLAKKLGIKTLASTALVSKGRAVGALTFGLKRSAPVEARRLELLTAIGQQIGIAVENAQLLLETERRARQLASLHRASVLLSSTLDPSAIHQVMTEQGARLAGVELAGLFLWNEANRHAECVASSGEDGFGSRLENVRLLPDDCQCMENLLQGRQTVTVDDGRSDASEHPAWWRELDVRAFMGVPVFTSEDPFGFLCFINLKQPRRWRRDEQELVESFANEASIALENAHLHQQAEIAAMLEERQRIAAEMHDGLAQTLSHMGHEVDRLTDLVKAGKTGEVVGRYDHMRDAIDRASLEVRRVIASLQEDPPAPRTLQDSLADTIGKVPWGQGPQMELVDDIGEPASLPPDLQGQVQRVVQEALYNAVRHSDASRVTVHLEKGMDEFRVTVEDDGRGFDQDQAALEQGHFGLKIMRARAVRLGGRIEVNSEPESGTQVMLAWPVSTRVQA